MDKVLHMKHHGGWNLEKRMIDVSSSAKRVSCED